jgi:N6-adenosine-specific RNA methylase IME4/ParB-like chromosome segregation protein Spo0J
MRDVLPVLAPHRASAASATAGETTKPELEPMKRSYQMFAPLSPQEYEALKEDIRERGILVPVEVDDRGNVLDGHHRQRIAKELKIDCPVVVRAGLAEHEKRLHAITMNVARRQVTDAQKVLLGMQVEGDVAERARRRMLAGGAELSMGTTRDEVARLVGLGTGRTYDRYKKFFLVLDDDSIRERARLGELSMREVRRLYLLEVKRKRIEDLQSKAVGDLPSGKFHVILADPPWTYQSRMPGRVASRTEPYPVMSTEEIIAVPIPAAKDAVLFLWTTNPMVVEALKVMEGWGFEYRTNAVWVKDKTGMGYYVRQQHELVLIGRRGDFPTPHPARRPPSVIQATRGRHSEKPIVLYELIEKMYPGFRYLEVFARTRRPGWIGWGNEA